jgi:hypothetical protein
MSQLRLGPDAVADVEECIFTFVRWGEHPYDEARRWSMDEMRGRLPDYPQIVADVRSGHAVKWFENLLGTTWQVFGEAAGTAVHNPVSGERHVLTGPGVIELATYVGRMGTAVEAWRRAVARTNPSDLLTAVGDGFGAIEAYLNSKARLWTAEHPSDPLEDTKESPVQTREKLNKWVPLMTRGNRIDPQSPFWRDLVAMQRYRNDEAIHPRGSSSAIDLTQFVQLLNMFTSGIAIPLLQLHTFYNEQMPSVIIRAAYAPQVGLVPGGAG